MQTGIEETETSACAECVEKDMEINTLRRALKKIHGDDNYTKDLMKNMMKMMKMLVFVVMFLVLVCVILMCILVNKWWLLCVLLYFGQESMVSIFDQDFYDIVIVNFYDDMR